MEKHNERVIGTFDGGLPGPLILATGAVHGNEPAGVKALEMVFEALEQERDARPGFQFRGKLIGLIGNLQAYRMRQRFVEQDLNRLWAFEMLPTLDDNAPETLKAENLEALQLYETIANSIKSSTPESVVFLDLHTTSAEGGVFSLPTDEAESLALAKHLGAPAIIGLQESLNGTLLGFAAHGGFQTNEMEPNPVCVAFEAGQHESPYAVKRSAIAVLRCMRTLGCISMEDLTSFEAGLTLPFFSYMPPVVRFRYAHHIDAADGFKMRPGYANFQPIQKGEHLADDIHGPVLAREKGLILMPLYQAKGSDGFFIVE